MGASGTGNDTFTITGAVTAGTGNDTFTIGSTGSANDTFTIGSINASGSSGNDTFTMGSSGTGNDTFTINGAVTGGTGNDTFIFTTGGGGNDTFTITGGVAATGSGNDTFVISTSGAPSGNTTLAMTGNFSGGSGTNQFFIQDTGTGGSNDTFTVNSNFIGGSGNDTFTITNHSSGNDTFTVNGGYNRWRRRQGIMRFPKVRNPIVIVGFLSLMLIVSVLALLLQSVYTRQSGFETKRDEGRAIVKAVYTYKHKEGHWPAGLADLTPKYLDVVPSNWSYSAGDAPRLSALACFHTYLTYYFPASAREFVETEIFPSGVDHGWVRDCEGRISFLGAE
jgi:hypothetical protein